MADQVLPVLATIQLQLTTTRLSFQPAALDFGQCNLGEKTGVAVAVTNHSRLSQKYGEPAAHHTVGVVTLMPPSVRHCPRCP